MAPPPRTQPVGAAEYSKPHARGGVPIAWGRPRVGASPADCASTRVAHGQQATWR